MVLARHSLSGVLVAVKFIDKSNVENIYTNNNEKFNEVQIMEEICRGRSKHLLDLIESFEDERYYFLVTNFMPGLDLQDYIFQQDLPLRDEHTARHMLLQICQGLQVMHNLNIVHRDIKLQNILTLANVPLTKLKLSDFGSAFRVDENDPSKGSRFKISTPGYSAPELLKGQVQGKPIDVYAVGAVLHNILTSQLPFFESDRDRRVARVCLQQLNTESNLLRNLTPQCKDLLSQLLEKDPERRPTIEQVLTHEWFTLS